MIVFVLFVVLCFVVFRCLVLLFCGVVWSVVCLLIVLLFARILCRGNLWLDAFYLLGLVLTFVVFCWLVGLGLRVVRVTSVLGG